MAWFLDHWIDVANLAAWLLTLAAWIAVIREWIRLRRALREERDAWWALDRVRLDQIVALSTRIYLLESRNVTAGVTTRNPSSGETPSDQS